MSKISELPLAGPITGAETLPVVQDGTAKRASLSGFIEGTVAAATATATAAATAAAESAGAAAGALTAVNDAGAAQVAAVGDAGAAQVALAAAQVAIAAQAAQGVAGFAVDGTLAPVHEAFGATNNATLATNVGVSQLTRVNGIDIQTGQEIAAIAWGWACAADTARVEVKVWARDVAGATGAGTLNNAAPIATHDVLIGTFETTPAAIGITPGTSTPALTRVFNLPAPFIVQAGKDYVFQFRNLNAGGVVVNCGIRVAAGSAGSQRRAGFRANTAAPTVFTNISAGGSTGAITLYRRRTASALGATDIALRLLLDRKMQETLGAMNDRNISNVIANAGAFRTVFAVPFNMIGDSLVEDATGAITPYRASEIVDSLTDGTVNNYGVGGQTGSAITARVVALSAGDKAGINLVQMLANDSAAATSAAAGAALYATCAAEFTNPNFIMCGTWTGSVVPRNRDVMRTLRATYGAKAWDSMGFWARYGAFASDFLAAARGLPADGLRVDTQHTNQAGSLLKGYEWAALGIASAGGAPYVHDQTVGMVAEDAPGTLVATALAVGEARNFQIVAGNEDGALTIDRTTGAMNRTTNPMLMPYREVFVEADNHRGRGRNGRHVIMQRMFGSNPQSAVQVVEGAGHYAQMPSTYAPADGTQMTVVVCARLDPQRINGNIISLNGAGNGLIQSGGNGLRFFAQGASLLGNLTLSTTSPSDWHFYFFSVDTVAGAIKGAVDEATASAACNAGNLAISTYNYFFNNTGNTLPWVGGLKMLSLYNVAYDVHDPAVRALLYDSVTRLPKDTGDGTAGGAFAAPLVYLRGMFGDHLLGKNFGTGGDLHTAVPIGLRHLGIVDAVA